MFVEKADRSKGTIGFYNKDVLHVWCITEGDALLCKTVIDLILHLINHKDVKCLSRACIGKKEAWGVIWRKAQEKGRRENTKTRKRH